jgi:hypothetical protein
MAKAEEDLFIYLRWYISISCLLQGWIVLGPHPSIRLHLGGSSSQVYSLLNNMNEQTMSLRHQNVKMF